MQIKSRLGSLGAYLNIVGFYEDIKYLKKGITKLQKCNMLMRKQCNMLILHYA